jgi:hypothetical protein
VDNGKQHHRYPDDVDLDVRTTLLEAAAERRQADRSEARLLALAVQIVHLVAERAVEELAAALDVSYGSGCNLVADALELRYRLPRMWRLVQSGRLQAWKARKVAQQTTHLGAEAVAFVDAQAALAGAKNRMVPNLAGLVHAAPRQPCCLCRRHHRLKTFTA